MKLQIAAVLVLLTMVPHGSAQTQTSKKQQAAEEQIKQLEIDRQNAFKSADIEALDRGTADDYISIGSSGATSTKQRMLDRLKSGSFKMQDITLSDLQARNYGNTAILTGRAHEISQFDGKPKDQEYLFTRVFVKNKGRWQAVSYQQTTAPAK